MLNSSVKPNTIDSQIACWSGKQGRLNYQQPPNYLNDTFLFGNNSDNCLGELLSGRGMKPDPGLENEWMLNYGNGSDSGTSNPIPRTASCPPDVAAAMAEMAANKWGTASSDVSSVIGNESFKKRKAEQVEKKTESTDEGSKITEDNTKSNKKKKVSDDSPKLDYIHVRARRGQATDSHSLAERVRREKISERMKYLQDLVPGCNKITGKAGMLDEIINYVQSLQRQVEFLSMKLANVNPCPGHFEVDNYLSKEMLPVCTSSMVNDAQLQFNMLTQGVSCSGIDVNHVLRRTTSAPVHIQDSLLDSSCFNQPIQHLTPWDTELQNLFTMEYLQGYPETGHVKMEM